MKKFYLSNMHKKLFGFLFLLMSFGVWGQTLVNYPFNNNLDPNIGPATTLNPILKYYDPPLEITPTDYTSGYLNFMNNGDEIRLTFDATNFSGLTVNLKERFRLFGFGSANIKVYLKVGTNPETLINNQDFGVFIFADHQRNITVPIPSADNQPNVTIRIVGTSGEFGLFNIFGIDDLSLNSNSPSIQPYGYDTTNNLTQIPHEADASVNFGTDFGKVVTSSLTTSGYSDRTFQIKNEGTATLNISSINFSGSHPSDFSIISSIPSSISAGSFANITVRFDATDNGKRTAILRINSNAIPPQYRFNVVGYGVSCDTFDVMLQSKSMESGQPNALPANPEGSSTFNMISGNAETHIPNTIPRLYAHDVSNVGLWSSQTSSWYTRNETSTVNFGPVNITNERGVYIAFNIAAFSTSTDNNNDKFRNGDYVEIQVLKPGTTNEWSREIRLTGPINGTGRYTFAAGSKLSKFYSGNGDTNPVEVIENENTHSTRFKSIELKLSDNDNFENLIFRIVVHSSHDRKLWLIDDVRVMSENSIYKTYTGIGPSGWQDLDGTNSSEPGKHEKAVFAANYDTSLEGDLDICECEINPGVELKIATGDNVEVFGDIVTDGSLLVETDGNLIQRSDNAINSGNIKVERLITSIHSTPSEMDYVYWSSPVTGQELKEFSPGTPNNRFFTYNESNDYFISANPFSDFISGKGYAIRAETGLDGQNKTYSFTGIPNNGNVNHNIEIVKTANGQGYNLVGNPYPSNIDADELFAANPSIYQSVFFWSNNNYNAPNQQGSDYDGSNYSVYNRTGGTPATYTAGTTVVTNGIIKVGQGFIVQKIANGNSMLNFDNSMRLSDVGTFYEKTNKDRFWLTLTTPSELVNTTLIGYIPGAVDAYDPNFDAKHLGGDDAIYSLLDNQNLVIQGFEMPFENSDIIPLGVRHFEAGKHIISLKTKEGIFDGNQNVYLKDKYLNKIHNLSKSNYKYRAEPGEFNDRFEIVFINSNMTAESVLATASDVKIQKINNQIVISSQKDQLLEVEIYNFAGWSLYQNNSVNAKELILPAEQFGKGIIVIKVQTETGEIVSRKMINK